MSVRIMSAIWDIRDLSPVEKLALLALADWANDEGDAWPSIKQIADKTGCGERTVQRAFRTAETMGILTRVEVTGKGCKYKLHPRHTGTPVRQAPPPQRHPTPASVAPNTPRNTILLDKANASSNKRASVLPKPDSVEQNVWNDFLDLRKAKRAPLSNTALAAIEREAALAGWPLNDALAECAARGWQGFKAKWVEEKAGGYGNAGNRQSDIMGRTERAALQALRDLGAIPADHRRNKSSPMPAAGGHAIARQKPHALLPVRDE